MSINTLFITTAIAALGVSSVATSANAQSSRYGGDDVYSYESGTNCNTNPCGQVAAPVKSSRYGGYAQQAPMQQAPVYVDCAQMGTCAPAPQMMAQPSTVYTQPAAPVYQQPQYTQQAQYSAPAQMAPVNCPAGTTAQPDGTCLQGSTSTYSGTTSYGSGTTSYGSSSSYGDYDVVIDSAPAMQSMPTNCPAGTTAQNDGTCMEGSSYSSSSTYSGSTSTYSGTTSQPTTSYDSGSVYSGDASASSSYGYTSDGAYTATDYLPVRK